jgi:hypothetical protein
VDPHEFVFISNNVDWGATLPLISVDVVEKSLADDGMEDVGVG